MAARAGRGGRRRMAARAGRGGRRRVAARGGVVKVVIEAVDGDRVRFACAAGTADARWVGEPPALGEHHVELEVSGTAAAAGGGERLEPGRLVARVDAIDDDGVVALRFCGGLVVLDEAGPATVMGGWVEVSDALFELFPVAATREARA
ncbi:hypothetical protein OJ997_36265, partial [Solirubrobacter phytolaccae]